MKSFIISSLMATGLLVAAPAVSTTTAETAKPTHLSWNERIALESSSPRVHVGHMYYKHENPSDSERAANGYRVVKDKTTINAYVPMNK